MSQHGKDVWNFYLFHYALFHLVSEWELLFGWSWVQILAQIMDNLLSDTLVFFLSSSRQITG